MRRNRKRRFSTASVVRTLILFFPAGIYMMWHRRCRWQISSKALVTAITLISALGLFMGTLSFFPSQQAQRAQASALRSRVQKDIILLADPDGTCYHVEGCIHLQEGALPIGLQSAYKKGIPADERCNPPRFDSRN